MNGLDQEQDFDFGGLLKSLFTMTPIGARWAQAQSALESISMRREYEKRVREQLRRQQEGEAEQQALTPYVLDPERTISQPFTGQFKFPTTAKEYAELAEKGRTLRGWKAAARPELYRTPTFKQEEFEAEPGQPAQFFRPQQREQLEEALPGPPLPTRGERGGFLPQTYGGPLTPPPAPPSPTRMVGRADVIEEPAKPPVMGTRQVQTGEREATLPEMLQRLGPDAPYALPRIAQHGSFFMPGSPEAKRWTAQQDAIKQAAAAANAADPTGGPVNRQVFIKTYQELGFGAELTGPEPAESRDEVIADLDAAMRALTPDQQKDPTVSGRYRQARRQVSVGAKDSSNKVSDFYTAIERFGVRASRDAQLRQSAADRQTMIQLSRDRLVEAMRTNDIAAVNIIADNMSAALTQVRAELMMLLREDPKNPHIEVLRRQEAQLTQLIQRQLDVLQSTSRSRGVVPPSATPQGVTVPPPAQPTPPAGQAPSLPGTATDPRRRLEEKYGVRIR